MLYTCLYLTNSAIECTDLPYIDNANVTAWFPSCNETESTDEYMQLPIVTGKGIECSLIRHHNIKSPHPQSVVTRGFDIHPVRGTLSRYCVST